MAFSNIAKIIQWNNEKGFGFAEANGVKYFVHISALGNISRTPKTGDSIIVESFEKTDKGPKIKKGSLDGVPLKNKRTSFKKNKAFSRYKIAVLVVATILCIGIYIGKNLTSQTVEESYNSIEVQSYTSKLEVAKYICDNARLPSNYVDKATGKSLYEQKTGNTFTKWNFNPLITIGVMIGGDSFDNREGLLPAGNYKEADVDYYADNRGTNRLVYTDNCNIYYTGNHYKSFSKIDF